MKQFRFECHVLDARTGKCNTSIYKIIKGHHSNPFWTANPGQNFHQVHKWIPERKELVATVPGYISYDEQKEWIELLSQ